MHYIVIYLLVIDTGCISTALENAKNESLLRYRFYNILFGVLKNKYTLIFRIRNHGESIQRAYILLYLYKYNSDQFRPDDVDVAKNPD